jgi:hypothetical protein
MHSVISVEFSEDVSQTHFTVSILDINFIVVQSFDLSNTLNSEQDVILSPFPFQVSWWWAHVINIFIILIEIILEIVVIILRIVTVVLVGSLLVALH